MSDSPAPTPRHDAVPAPAGAQAVVWPWRSSVPASPEQTSRAARFRAVLPLLVSALLWRTGRTTAAGVVAILGAALLTLALAKPDWHARFEHAMQRFGLAVGTAVTWLLLLPVWWLCFVPGRLAFALAGKDPLQRRLLPNSQSYWLTRRAPTSADHWQRQF